MNTYKQEASYYVHLRKAKKSINFILSVSLFIIVASLIPGRITQTFFVQLAVIISLYLSGQLIFKHPIIGVVLLGGMILFYMVGWYDLLSGNHIPISFGIGSTSFIYSFILLFRGFTTLVIIGGFYFAVKGMIEKEQFEKTHGTLDEDEF